MICSSSVCVATGIEVILAAAVMSASSAVTSVRTSRGRVLSRNPSMISRGIRGNPRFSASTANSCREIMSDSRCSSVSGSLAVVF